MAKAKALAQEQHYNFFHSVEQSFDKAAQFTKWEKGILEQIKACNGYSTPITNSPAKAVSVSVMK
jgi:hypothetical protein